MKLHIILALLATAAITGCASKPVTPFSENEFEQNKKDYIKKYADVSSGGLLDNSKKVIVPDFKIYFQTQAKGAAESGNFLTTNNARVQGKLRLAVDPKVLQELTDLAYEKFVNDMKSLGYEVIDQTKLSEAYPDFKKYLSEDHMKASPQDISGQYIAYSPTGWKMELPGVELGLNAGGMFKSAFRQNLMKLAAAATDKLDAIQIQPVLIVGMGTVEGRFTHTTASVEAKQNVAVLALSKYNFSEDWSRGYIQLEKNLESNTPYGKIVRADTATDKTRGFISALGYGLGKSENTSGTWLVEADAELFKKAAWPVIKSTQEIFKAKIKEEL